LRWSHEIRGSGRRCIGSDFEGNGLLLLLSRLSTCLKGVAQHVVIPTSQIVNDVPMGDQRTKKLDLP